MSVTRSVGFACMVACSAAEDIPPPMIATLMPDHAPAGSVIEITGAYFCQLPEADHEDLTCEATGSVRFDTTPGTATTWSDTSIMVEVPAIVGRVAVTVTAKARASNSVDFTAE